MPDSISGTYTIVRDLIHTHRHTQAHTEYLHKHLILYKYHRFTFFLVFLSTVKFDMGAYKSNDLKRPVTLRISDTRLFLSAQNEGESVLLKVSCPLSLLTFSYICQCLQKADTPSRVHSPLLFPPQSPPAHLTPSCFSPIPRGNSRQNLWESKMKMQGCLRDKLPSSFFFLSLPDPVHLPSQDIHLFKPPLILTDIYYLAYII